jgi:hypothetical protein
MPPTTATEPPAFLSPTEQGGTTVGRGSLEGLDLEEMSTCEPCGIVVDVSSLWLAQACNGPGSEKTKVQSVGQETGERVYFASQETGRQTVKTNQTR